MGLTETKFQGQPAFWSIERREGTFDDPPSFSYRLYFEREDVWYRLIYEAPLDFDALPEIVQMYLDTFRVESADKQAK